MATLEDRNQRIQAIQNNLSGLVKIDPQSLARAGNLPPSMEFSEAVPIIRRVLDMFKRLHEGDLDLLNSDHLADIEDCCNRFKGLIDKIRTFSVENSNQPLKICKEIIGEIQNSYDGFLRQLSVPLAITATQIFEIEVLKRELREMQEAAKRMTLSFDNAIKLGLSTSENYIDSQKKQFDEALEAVKAQTAKVGVIGNAGVFLQAATHHEEMAKRWFRASLVTFILTALFGEFIFYLSLTSHPKTTLDAIQIIGAKVILLSILSYAVIWTARNYRIQKHNEMINRHRSNSLQTFQTFVSGTHEDSIKDAILIQASQSIFSHRPTGYETSENESTILSPIIEVIGKSASQGGKA